MTFSVSQAFMKGSDSPPVDTDSPNHLVSPSNPRSQCMNVPHGTGVSAVLTLHQFFSIYIGSYIKIKHSQTLIFEA